MLVFDFYPFPDFTTTRLNLRSFKKHDATSLFETRAFPENSRYLDRTPYQKIKEADDFIDKIMDGVKNNKWINWGITLKDNPKMVGSICLWNLNAENATGELGYEMHPDFQGKGIMTESIGKIIEYGFTTMQLQKIEAVPHQDNKASIRVLEKFNFKYVGNLEGKDAQLAIYELTVDDFMI